MAAAGSLVCEKELECPICFDLFENPVSLPCGHSFCDACIQRHWKDKEQWQCPLCKQEFNKSLKLRVNTLFRDIVEKYKHDHVLGDNKEPISPEDVPCDCCLHSRRRAVKTCLVCLTSYCDTHLEPHLRVAALKTHKLTDPVPKLEEKTCGKHNRFLEENSSDQKPVCTLCAFETQVQTDKKCDDTKTHPENQYKDAHYIKVKNPRKKNKNKRSHVAPKTADREVTEDSDKPEDLENVHIWLDNGLSTFSRLPLECGFSSGRVYYDIPITQNGEWALGVVIETMRGKRVFTTKPFGCWVVKYCPTLCAVAECPICKSKFPDRLFLCVDYEKGHMLLVHPFERNVIFFYTNCRFKGKLFLFTHNYKRGKREPFINCIQGTAAKWTRNEGVLFMFLGYLLGCIIQFLLAYL